MVNAKEFQKFLDRDGGCVHCGDTSTVVPHHRLNRGMGGAKSRHTPANIVVVCAWLNFAMEADDIVAADARRLGWKLRTGQNPTLTPLYDAQTNEWVLLGDMYTRHVIGSERPTSWL